MKQKKIPLRKCLITNEQYPKHEMVRIVVDKEKNVSIDLTGKKNGRGAYIKLDKENIQKAKTRKVFEREFKVDNLDDIYTQLEEMANE